MSAALLTTTVTILRATQTGVDRQNRPVWAWNPVAGGETVKARREQQAGRETTLGTGETAIADWLWWLEPKVDVKSTDRLQHSSGLYEVTGPPEDWADDLMYAAFPHLEVMARFLGA